MRDSKRGFLMLEGTRRWAALVAVAAVAGTLAVAGARLVAAQGKPVVVVAPGDAQDLYAKLKDPATAGYTLVLAGTYILTAQGEGAATKGYIELGDRNLLGTNRNVDTDGDGVPDWAGEER